MIGHNGYGSCLKCTTDGEYSYEFSKMIFPQLNAPLRTDENFRSKMFDDHHKNTSVLEQIVGIDMIKDFPIGDALHLIDLGIMKHFLTGWKNGTLHNLKARWSAREAKNISDFLTQVELPREIRRPVRGLDHLQRWKGTEFRTFLFYLSIIVLNKFFNHKDIYHHFLNFFCAIQICVRHDQDPKNYQIARAMLHDFLNGVKSLYGKFMFSSNMHNLVHLIDDVERFGPLDTFDAYPFESKLYVIKNMIRSGNLPLSQIAKRLTEIQKNATNIEIHFNKNEVQLKKKADLEDVDKKLRKIVKKKSLDLYNFVQLGSFCLDTKRKADCWILTKQLEVVKVDMIAFDSKDKTISLYGAKLKTQEDYFKKPVLSSALQIYASDLKLNPSELLPLDKLRCKMVCINTNDKNLPKSVFIPLLHTLKIT